MLCWEMRSYRMAQEQAGPVFFDRGVPDIVGYLRMLGLRVPKHMENTAEVFRYNRRVVIAPTWPEIFQQDSERKQSLDEAVRTYEAMVAAYSGYGYELVEVPRCTVEEKVRFVIESAAPSSAPARSALREPAVGIPVNRPSTTQAALSGLSSGMVQADARAATRQSTRA